MEEDKYREDIIDVRTVLGWNWQQGPQLVGGNKPTYAQEYPMNCTPDNECPTSSVPQTCNTHNRHDISQFTCPSFVVSP